MWKARLKSVQETPAPSDTVDINIEYYETVSGKSFVKGYNLHASNFPTKQSFLDFVANEIQTLTRFDNVVSVLKTYVGKEIA